MTGPAFLCDANWDALEAAGLSGPNAQDSRVGVVEPDNGHLFRAGASPRLLWSPVIDKVTDVSRDGTVRPTARSVVAQKLLDPALDIPESTSDHCSQATSSDHSHHGH